MIANAGIIFNQVTMHGLLLPNSERAGRIWRLPWPEPIDKRVIDQIRHPAIVVVATLEYRKQWVSSCRFQRDHGSDDGVNLEYQRMRER